MKNISVFRKNIGVSILASVISFIVSLVLTPIMTRYFDPSDYGVFAVINNIATFTATFFLFSLPNAIPMEPSWHRRSQLLHTLLHISVFAFLFTVFGTVVFLVVKYFFYSLNENIMVYIFLPFLVFTIMLLRTAQGWATADGTFTSLAFARVGHSFIAKLFPVLASMLSTSNPFYMVFFEALGFSFQVFILVRNKISKFYICSRFFTLRRMKISVGMIKRYKDYSLYLNLVNLILLGSISLQVIILSMHYSTVETGVYTLALSMTNLPVQLISLATASVVYHRFIAIASDHSQVLFGKTVKYLIGYIVLGLLPYIGIYMYSEPLFGIVFGTEWSQSGKIASILALPMYLQFILYPILSIFRVTKTIKLQFKIDMFFNILLVIILYVVSFSYSFVDAVIIHSIMMSFYIFISLLFCLYVAWNPSVALEQKGQE